ncbi:MAG: UDP-glucose/GDP-mannose dehydrogenase family protein [Candidatus Aminicenantes bacterium]|nr:UDP-glucose/GDP-mannose dehydrogenase family protein [Candidatus Aminicenantes bacterium]
MKIAVVGTGYVGLVTATCLAELGHAVIGLDKDRSKIVTIRSGRAPFYEPGLDDLLAANLKKGTLRFTDDEAEAIRASEVIFVCVGTPPQEDGSADMSQIEEVARTIAANLNGYKLVVEKSTVPVKTSAWIKKVMTAFKKSEHPFDVASNPEFLREGSGVEDFMNPDRVMIGVETERARDLLVRIYERFRDRVVISNIDTAELVKHASNSFLAMKISFINRIADLCERTDADVEMVARGMGLDDRIGKAFLKAGLGYGGSCFPKDVKALAKIGSELGVDMALFRMVDAINEDRIRVFVEKVRKAVWILKGKTVGVLGLAFKPETDDIREAPSIKVIDDLLKQGARLRLYDPKAADNMKGLFPEDGRAVTYVSDPYEAARGAHILLVVTEWDEIRRLDLAKVKALMVNPVLIDGRNVFDPAAVRALGFEYASIGRA